MINDKMKNVKMGTRDGFGEALVELGEKDPRVVVLTGDLMESTRVEAFAKKFPERFFECGVAEQNMMGIAAGLAAAGKIPFITSYAVFSPGRNWDQLRVSVCYSNLPVKIIGCHAGLSVGPDGATHQALEDIAMTRVLPNLKVIVPADYYEARESTFAAAMDPAPVYIRLVREKTAVINPNPDFKIGKISLLTKNANPHVAIIGCGPILYECLEASKNLAKQNISTQVINCSSIKPLDRENILNAVKNCSGVVTAEEHQINGGLGGAIAELLSQHDPKPMEFVGVKDTFGESGKPEELAEKYGLKAYDVEEAVKRVLQRSL
jgi:Transketolase, C-terminal subunit